MDSHWVDQERSGAIFADERVYKTFRSLLERLAQSPGDSIPRVSGLGNTKAAYWFLDKGWVSEADSLAGYFEATADRAAATTGRFWYCTTPRNSAINGESFRRSARRAPLLSVFTETVHRDIPPPAAS